ncbi:RICIN domain-containing protein [Embleya sp. AB8]|uniref:RICIN domain-containing protein n=1 Tax=Embleya sp. AB8 TaxID=3156304 RepID=UPI003C75757F
MSMRSLVRPSVFLAATTLAVAAGVAAPAHAAGHSPDGSRRAAGAQPAASFWDEMHNRNSGKCVDVKNDSSDAGAWIQQYHCDHTPASKFLFADLGNGYFEIEGQNSHKCIQPQNGWGGNGVPLYQWYCNAGDAQQWQLQAATAGSYRVANKATGMCIDVPGWSSDDWVTLQQWTCVAGAANQEFYLQGG